MFWVIITIGILAFILKGIIPTGDDLKRDNSIKKMAHALQKRGIVPTYSRYMHDGSWQLSFDDTNKMMYYVTPGIDESDCTIAEFKYQSILSYELETDDGTIISENTTGKALGRAAIGGALAGGIGAAIGGVTTKQNVNVYHNKLNLIVHFKDSLVDRIVLRCMEQDRPEDSEEYKISIKGVKIYMDALDDAMMKGNLSECIGTPSKQIDESTCSSSTDIQNSSKSEFEEGQLVIVKKDESHFQIEEVNMDSGFPMYYSSKHNCFFNEDEIEDFEVYRNNKNK